MTTLSTILKSVAVALALAVAAGSAAHAGGKSGGGHHGGHHVKPYHYGYGWTRPHYPHVQFYYQKPYHGGFVAWTPDWYAYCRARYKSFNPATGHFKGYDGRYYFCR